MANISNFITPAAGGGGGGGIPETAIFTETTVWTVPQSIRDQIASEGHAEVGLFMVGGGSGSGTGLGGEIVNELYQLTTADYDNPTATNPTITVVVGTENQPSGITRAANLAPIVQNGPGTPFLIGNLVYTSNIVLSNFNLDSDGNPLLVSVNAQDRAFETNANPTRSTASAVTARGTQVLPTPGNPQPFLEGANNGFMATWTGPNTVPATLTRAGNVLTLTALSAPASGTRWNTLNNPPGGVNIPFVLNFEAPVTAEKQARPGGSPEANQFLNNNRSTEGYFGGFARVGGQRPNSGQAVAGTGQSGFVQIFY